MGSPYLGKLPRILRSIPASLPSGKYHGVEAVILLVDRLRKTWLDRSSLWQGAMQLLAGGGIFSQVEERYSTNYYPIGTAPKVRLIYEFKVRCKVQDSCGITQRNCIESWMTTVCKCGQTSSRMELGKGWLPLRSEPSYHCVFLLIQISFRLQGCAVLL